MIKILFRKNYLRRISGVKSEKFKKTTKIFPSIRNAVNKGNVHILDITADDNSFFYGILQSLQPDIRCINVTQGNENWQVAEILRKVLCSLPDKKRKSSFPFSERYWESLEEKLNRKILIIDAISQDSNCVKHLDPNFGSWFFHCVSRIMLKKTRNICINIKTLHFYEKALDKDFEAFLLF